MCTCQDRRVFLELLIELQARRIVELEQRIQHHPPKYMTPELHGITWEIHDDRYQAQPRDSEGRQTQGPRHQARTQARVTQQGQQQGQVK
jgi:hypothetical protein